MDLMPRPGSTSMAGFIRVFDWASSPVGERATWPSSLRVIFDFLLAAPNQIVLFWGPDYLAFYNDAYAPTIGEKHPSAFGGPASENWAEMWGDLKPLLDQVRLTGVPVFAKDRPFYIERFGYPETVTFDISYSPVFGEDGVVAGVLCMVNETTERTRYQAKLIESEERFRQMAGNAPVMIWVTDAEGRAIYHNAFWYRFTGQTEAAAAVAGWLDVIHAEDRERVESAFLHPASELQPIRIEYRLRRVDGVYRWALDTAEPRFSSNGEFLGYIGSVIDIDERHEAERRLEESEAQFKAVANSVDQMIWSTRPDGYHDYYNDRWYEYTGVPHGSTDGEAWNGMFHPEDRERAWAVWRHCLETGEPYHIEYRLRHRSGAYRWVIGRANCVRDDQGRIVRWYGTCTDFHELKIAEIERAAIIALQQEIRALDEPADIAHAAARMLGEAMKASRAGYGTVDADAETITVEKDWIAPGVKSIAGVLEFRNFGNLKEDLRRGRMVALTDVTTDPRTASHADEFRAIDALSVVNIPIRERTGLVALFYIADRNRRRWTPEELRFIADVAELTRHAVERRRAENEFRDLTRSLEQQIEERTAELLQSETQLRQSQKMEAVGQLTGGIAHDFNNNLAVVISGLNLLSRKLERGETDVKRFIDGAMEGARRAASLTQRLLAFSRQQPLSPEIIDANRLILGMSEMLKRSLGDHVEIDIRFADDLWPAQADVTQLENAVINLAVNARDAMPDGGRLLIETSNAEVVGRKAGLNGPEPGRYVTIAVRDNGTGMPADVAARAFEPFYTTKEVGKGTGLGLSQVFGFVRQSEGYVAIDTEPDAGTTVTIYLPRSGRQAGVSEAEVAVPAKGRISGEKILVVEDEDRVRTFSVESLRELGYDAVAAASGAEALHLLRNGLKADLLFTDMVMPGMSGRRLAELAHEMDPSLKVLFTTGYAREDAVSPEPDAVRVVRKPYDIETLGEKVREALGEQVTA